MTSSNSQPKTHQIVEIRHFEPQKQQNTTAEEGDTGDACALETRRRFVTERGKKKEESRNFNPGLNAWVTSFSGFLKRIKLSSRRIIGTNRHLNVPSKRMILTVVYLHVFLQNTYCCQEATIPIPALLSTKSLEMKWRAIY